jgi:hypothetical protein
MRSHAISLGIALAGAVVSANGQWLNYPAPGTPMTRGGKRTWWQGAARAKWQTGPFRRFADRASATRRNRTNLR